MHRVGSSSSICSFLAATTLGVIVPDRDEKRGEDGEEGDIGAEGAGAVGRKASREPHGSVIREKAFLLGLPPPGTR